MGAMDTDPMIRLATLADRIAAYDRRDEDEAAALHRQARALLAAGAVIPSGRTSAGRTAASLFDRVSASRIAVLLTLGEAGLTVPELRTIAPLLDVVADRPRAPNVSYPSSGLVEAVGAVAAGESGWALMVEVLRGPNGRRFGVQITAPDTNHEVHPFVARIIAAQRAASGERILLRITVDLADRLAPVLAAADAAEG